MKVLLLLLSGWMTVGCTGNDEMQSPMDAPIDPAPQKGIEDAINSIQSDPCITQDDASHCQWDDYEIGPTQFSMTKSTGETILIIDELAGFVPELVRYRNRILSYYRING